MTKRRRLFGWTAPALGAVGSLIVLGCAAAALPQFEIWHWGLWVGGTLSLSGAAWSGLLWGRASEQADRRRAALSRRGQRLKELRKRLEFEAFLLERQRRKLAGELVHRELYEGGGRVRSAEAEGETSPQELAEADRKVLELCRAESERVFEKISRNVYMPGGVIQPREILADAGRLFEAVARIYRPKSGNPMLETSVEDILRFIQRTSLQVLVQLEQLPLDIQRYNLRELHSLIQRALGYYGIYKSVSAYWDHARPLWYLGRLALGANPLTLGLTWTLSEIAARGGRQITQRYGRRYGLRLLHETIRIIGTEAASVYGGDFRGRDPNWIYGLELTELQKVLPVQRRLLRTLLEEIGSMPLGSEYDRIFLFRCLARGESGDPSRFHAAATLRIEERRAIARRLETIVSRYRDLSGLEALSRWKTGVEARLGIRVEVEGCEGSAESGAARVPLLTSLASYLIGHKGLEWEEAAKRLANTRIAGLLGSARFEEAATGLSVHPPMLFDHPSVRPAAQEGAEYVADLAQFQCDVPPFEPGPALLEEAAAAVGYSPEGARARFREVCVERFRRNWAEDAPETRTPSEIVEASLYLLAGSEEPAFLYKRVQVRGLAAGTSLSEDRMWLLGTTASAVMLCGFGTGEDPKSARVLWRAEAGGFRARVARGLFGAACVLRGGSWDPEALPGEGTSIEVHGRPARASKDEFRPLLRLANRE